MTESKWRRSLRNMLLGGLALGCPLLIAAFALAPTGDGYDLTWNTIDGGGWMWSTGGDYSLGGTIGQADAGVDMAGGGYSLTGGFWAVPVYNAADFDCDGDADLADFLMFQKCFNGPNRAPKPACEVDGDLDDDTDVDLADFLIFQKCFNGPNRPPKCL